MINLTVDNQPVSVLPGTTVAAAVMAAGATHFRRSITGKRRGPLCGMGVCFECRVTIDGVPLERSCTIIAREGMEVVTDD